jgi:hypothetical protein
MTGHEIGVQKMPDLYFHNFMRDAISPLKTTDGGLMKCKKMAAIRRRCPHKVRQFDTQCPSSPNIAGLDVLCVIGLAIRWHMCRARSRTWGASSQCATYPRARTSCRPRLIVWGSR